MESFVTYEKWLEAEGTCGLCGVAADDFCEACEAEVLDFYADDADAEMDEALAVLYLEAKGVDGVGIWVG